MVTIKKSENKGLVVLSLFDGISCGKVALDKAGIKVNTYFASEIKKHAIICSKDNHENIIYIGDVTKVSYSKGVLKTENGNFKVDIDIIIGGSPCQDFSIANRSRLGLKGNKSKLFYEFLRIKEEVNPKYFLLENVKMKKEAEKELNSYLGVVGLYINSNLVSFQNRQRVYWTNIPNVVPPEDKKINFQTFKGLGDLEEARVHKTPSRYRMWNGGGKGDSLRSCKNITKSEKVGCLTRKQDRCPNSGLIEYQDFCRFLTRSEMELAQTLPEGYTKKLSYNQAQDVIGDGWTVDVLAHIFSFIII